MQWIIWATKIFELFYAVLYPAAAVWIVTDLYGFIKRKSNDVRIRKICLAMSVVMAIASAYVYFYEVFLRIHIIRNITGPMLLVALVGLTCEYLATKKAKQETEYDQE